MANTIRHKRNSTAAAVPAAASLSTGELAINTADGKLFTKKDDLSVIEIGIVKPDIENNFTALQTLTAGLKLEDAALNTTILSQDNTTSKLLEISSYYSGSAAQFPWLKNDSGSIITIGDLDGYNFPLSIVWDCENGLLTMFNQDVSLELDGMNINFSTLGGIVSINSSGSLVTGFSTVTSGGSYTGKTVVVSQTATIGASAVVQGTGTLTTTAITQVTLLSLSSTTYSSVKYFIQARNTTTSRFQITEIVATRNATTTVVTATPVDTNTGGVACTYAVDISASNFRLRITPQAASSTVFKVFYTAIP